MIELQSYQTEQSPVFAGDGICAGCEMRLGLRELYYYGMCERCYYFGHLPEARSSSL